MEVVDNVIDVQIILSSFATLGILVKDMVLLVRIKLLLLPTESVNTTREVREYNILRRDTVSYDVEVGSINGNAVGITALDALEHDIAGQPRGRRNETTICELGCDARHYMWSPGGPLLSILSVNKVSATSVKHLDVRAIVRSCNSLHQ
jgi:hypothetical protein